MGIAAILFVLIFTLTFARITIDSTFGNLFASFFVLVIIYVFEIADSLLWIVYAAAFV